MNNKSLSFFIEPLDNGFLVKEGNSKRAIEKYQTIEDIVTGKVKDLLAPLRKTGTKNLVISIQIDENVPLSNTQ